MDKKYGFVILHYLALNMTIECVDNLINRFKTYDIKIVIVDNASKNNSGKELKDYYADNEIVYVLLNDNNDGFAKGNNLGYEHLVKRFDLDYIVVMNNDVLIRQDNFLDLIDKSYNEHKFAILGPDIYAVKRQIHQSPSRKKELSFTDVKNLKNSLIQINNHPLISFILDKKSKNNQTKESNFKEYKEDIVLHGACYIFSKEFIKCRNYCFNPNTFLYLEEDILYYECKNKRLKMIYDPSLVVEHLEDVSTKLSYKSAYQRYKNKNKELYKSICVLEGLMLNHKD